MTSFVSEIESTNCVFIGQLDGNADESAAPVLAFWNGRQFGVFSAGFYPHQFGEEGIHRNAIVVPLPVTELPEHGVLRLTDEVGARWSEFRLTIQHSVHKSGLNATEILRLQNSPISKLQYAAMSSGTLRISGFAQTGFAMDNGVCFKDRSSIAVSSDPSISAVLDPFVLSQGHEDVFWYVPAAKYCGVVVDIDLGISVPDKSEIEVRLELGSSSENMLSHTTWVPLDLRRYMNFPDHDRLQRVQADENAVSVCINGYSDARRMREIFRIHGLNLYRKHILDWGCGHGRVLRHFVLDGDLGRVAGVDIDPDNVSWARTALRNNDLCVGPLMPPTSYEDNSFDGVYGISVMTHLDTDVQSAWLEEIRRILRPGGLALLTFAGAGSVAYGSRYFSRSWLDEWFTEGVNATAYESFDSVIGKKDYYRNVFMTTPYMNSLWSRSMSVEAVYENMFGYQSVAVLRK